MFYYTTTVPLTPNSTPPKFYVFRGNKLQSDVVDILESSEAMQISPYSGSCSSNNANSVPCFSLTIKGATFS